ncbi:hypothetical protein KAU32_01280 [bacterium]|nr:hypothetical protein [bacterium]
MNYIVITTLPDGKILVQVMNENQYNALNDAGQIEGATVYKTDLSIAELAQLGFIGVHDAPALAQLIIDHDSDIDRIEGPIITPDLRDPIQ